ncbi:MAG: hypothetical protein KIS61_37290, partial [Candidatus Eremiobacteraeota bacterium]|nr:hypothetical protein [Candidatus Eremiobacteraeota bacterium]
MGRNHNLWLNLGAFGVIGGVALFYVKGSFNAVVWPVLGLVGVAGLLQVSFRLGGSTVRPPKAPPPPPPKPAPSKAPAIVMEDLRVVREVGRYALVKELGRGAFGTVYKAVDTQCLDRFWAIKETELSLDSRHSMEDLRNFFDQEQKVLSW